MEIPLPHDTKSIALTATDGVFEVEMRFEAPLFDSKDLSATCGAEIFWHNLLSMISVNISKVRYRTAILLHKYQFAIAKQALARYLLVI